MGKGIDNRNLRDKELEMVSGGSGITADGLHYESKQPHEKEQLEVDHHKRTLLGGDSCEGPTFC